MPAPTISLVQPTRASAGNTVAIHGSGFTGATAVKFGSTNATFTVVSDARINATVPAGSGTLLITVVNPSGTSNGKAFTYSGTPGARITGISPAASGPSSGGNVVAIVGTGFTGVTAVKFGNVDAISYNVVGPTVINNVVVPPGVPGTALVTVVTASGPGGGFAYDYVGAPTSTTTLMDAPDPSVVGESVTFTATVAPVPPNMGTPTGTVTFNFGDGSPAVVVPLTGGVASTTHAYTTTSGSPFTVTAVYSGDSNFSASVGTGSHVVNAAASSTVVVDSPDPSVVGQSVTFTATVSAVSPGSGTPTGSVVFDFGDGNVSAAVPLSGGVASTTHTYTTTSGSPFTVTATYGGSANFSASVGTGSHVVNAAASSTVVVDSPDPSVVGQSVTFTATVSAVSPGSGTPTGSVVFDFGDGNVSAAVPLSGGVASTTHTYTTTSGSPFTVTATYGGSANFSASVGTGSHVVNAAASSTVVVDSPDPSVVGQSVTFTATVSAVSPGSGTPTGSVVFDFGDGNVSGPVALAGGTTSITHAYTTTSGSPFTVTATYGGSANFSASVGTGSHVVNAAASSTVVVDSPDPSVVGQSVTFTATVSAVSPGSGTPTGSVVFDFGDGNVSAAVPLVAGVASTTHAYTTTSGSPFTVTATYGGSANFSASVGTGSHVVNAAASSTVVVDSPDPSVVGQSVTFTATVSAVSPGSGVPTGSVVFDFGDGNVSAAVPLSGGVATISHAYATVGGSPYTVTATYGGSANFSGSAGTDAHVVNAAASSTVVAGSPDPSVVGQSVTFTATVSAVPPGGGVPTGSVVFDFGDGNVSAAVPLSGGVASTTHTYTTTSGSPFTVTATYTPDDGDYVGSAGTDAHVVNAAASSTVVVDSPDPSVVGQSVTFTATVSAVSPGSGTPTGSVVFDFGDGNVSAAVPLSGGAASTTHTYTTTSGSPFTVTATYGGSANFSGSVGTDAHVVNAAATSTVVAGSPDPSLVGESVSFTATVSAVSPGSGTPTGSVVFDFGDGNVSAAVPLVGGVANTTHAYATVGGSPFTVTATYGGSANFSGSVGTDAHVVNAAATSTVVAGSPDPSLVGESVSFTATVSAVSPGSGTPTGSVVFDFGDGNVSAAVPLVAGAANTTHAYDTVSGSPFTVTATYTPDDADYVGSAGTDAHVVNAAATSTVVAGSPDPSLVGQLVSFTATVSAVSPGGGTPTGSVVFDFGDGNVSGSVPLSGGAANTTHAYATVGGSPFTVTATYTPDDADYVGSAGTDAHVVNAAATSTVVAGSPDPSLVGESVSFTATVSAVSPGGGTPTGSVVFDFGDGNVSGSVPLSGGAANTTHAYDTVSGSPFTVTATYTPDDADYVGSAGTDAHVVNAAATSTVVAGSPDPSLVGESVSFTATVSAVSPGGGTPTGSVVFDFGDGNVSGSVPLVAGAANTTHAYDTVSGSPFTVTATYTPDDADYVGSAGTDAHVVNAAATSTVVAGSPDPSLVGESVSFTATVSAVSPGGGTPTGSVVFDFGDGNVSGSVPLSGGAANTTHAYATVGGSPFTVTATYTPDDADYVGSAGTDAHVVNAAATSTVVAGSPDPSLVGESVTFTATVSAVSPGGGTPTGSVVFDFGDGNVSGSVPLSGGAANTTHAYDTVSGSPFTVTATYTPDDADYVGSAGTDAHVVNAAATSTALAGAPDPSLVGQSVTFTATVSAASPGGGTPTGSVVFDFGDGNVSGSVPLVAGVASTTHAYATVSGSPYTVTATYTPDDADYLGSAGTDAHVVNPSATTTTIFDDLPDPSVVGQSVDFTVHVNAVAPGGGTPTGSVVLDFGDGNVSAAVPLSGGVATVSHTYNTTVGSPFTVTATYTPDDADYTASAGSAGHTVNP